MIVAMLAMAISMVLIPVMMRLAPVLGMIDAPDPRKVHKAPIPRVGGVGIVVGALLPMLYWLPYSDLVISILFSSFVLLVFGLWDDAKELGHYVKFIGQFIAAVAVVYYGGLYVEYFPFAGVDPVSPDIGKPFTVIAIVGAINALNHSDGLDGLAGGEALLSLGAIAWLAYSYQGELAVIMACATIGGVFGFLRFNSHPARVFMGDGGSQFIGFMIAVLVVMLTQKVNHTFSPAIALLLIGLPVADILAVFFLRAKGGMNLFRATSNHIHHRLLQLGFKHYESVILIYSVQALLVVSAVLMPYENDYFLISLYLLVCSAVFAVLTFMERSGMRMHVAVSTSSDDGAGLTTAGLRERLSEYASYVVETGLLLFLFASAVASTHVPMDFTISAAVLLIALVFALWRDNKMILRLVTYTTVTFSVYLLSKAEPAWLLEDRHLVYTFFAVLTIATFLEARWRSNDSFAASPLDYLVVIIVVIVALVNGGDVAGSDITWMALQMIVLFYAAELVIQQLGTTRGRLGGALTVVLAVMALRGAL